MSKKTETNSNPAPPNKKQGTFPLCINKNEARMVCLSQHCQDYPFFCSTCEDSSCEIAHQHDDKLVSVSYKQFTKRVLKERKPKEKLNQAMDSYRKVLQKLKEDVNEFIIKQFAQLDQISKKAEQIPEKEAEIINKIRNQQYEGFTGVIMDQLWTKCAEDPQRNKVQSQTAQFIKTKEEEVKGLSEHFQHLNHIDYESLIQDEEENSKKGSKPKLQTTTSPPSIPKKMIQ